MGRSLKQALRKATKPVKVDVGVVTDSRYTKRINPVPEGTYEEIEDAHMVPKRGAEDYETITVTGSTGKTYKVVIPASYINNVPRTWKWDARRYKCAELIAMGIPYTQIADHPEVKVSRMTIYCWLEHPEFREHVDGLTLETGFANKRERIAGMTRVTQKLFDKIINELDGVKLTDKSVGSVLTAMQQFAKHVAQEKEEFIEESKVKQDTKVSGTLGVATMNIDNYVRSQGEDDRKLLEEEFRALGDEIIRGITGEK
jgi:hypothetical protein